MREWKSMQSPLALLWRTPLYWRIFLAVQMIGLAAFPMASAHENPLALLVTFVCLLPGFFALGYAPYFPTWLFPSGACLVNFVAWWLARQIINRCKAP
jgi:hypothetical protein